MKKILKCVFALAVGILVSVFIDSYLHEYK